MKSLLVLLSIVSLDASANYLLHKPKAKILDKGTYQFDLGAKYFETMARINSEGEDIPFDEGAGFSRIDVDADLYYSFTKSLEFNLGGRYRMVENASADQTISVSGAESFWIGAKYPFASKSNLKFAVGATYRQTFYTNESYTNSSDIPSDEQVLGDSGNEFSFNFYSSWLRRKDHTVDMMVGYRIPPNNLSSEIPYDVSSFWHFTNWTMGLGVDGVMSLSSDEYSDVPSQKPLQATGETFQFNSINRSFVRPYGEIGYAFNKIKLSARFASVIQASSYDKGYVASAMLTYIPKTKKRKTKKVDTFKEYDIEATVLKLSPRGKFVKIDHGAAQDVEKGMRFDVFKTDYFGGNELVASGHIVELGANWAIIKLTKKYTKTKILKGFIARASS